MKLVTSAQMRAIDHRAINELGIPGLQLMENAGQGIAVWIREIFRDNVKGKHFAIVCGKGNNGGDGYVIARYLHQWGANVEVFLLGERGGRSRAMPWSNLHQARTGDRPFRWMRITIAGFPLSRE